MERCELCGLRPALDAGRPAPDCDFWSVPLCEDCLNRLGHLLVDPGLQGALDELPDRAQA